MARKRVIELTADATLSKNQSGSLIVFNAGTGIVATLPTGSTGLNYEFIVRTDNSSNVYKIDFGSNSMVGWGIVTSATGEYTGAMLHFLTDLTGRVVCMASATTGGLIGTRVKVVCDEDGVWHCEYFGVGNAAAATSPFGAL
jgi:hypothetical protein